MSWGSLLIRHSMRCRAPIDRPLRLAWQRRRAAIILIAVFVVNCGGEPRLVPPGEVNTRDVGTPIATPSSRSEIAPEPSLGEIVWASTSDPVTNAPTATVTAYSPESPRISASAPIQAFPSPATIEASWEYNDTPLEAFTRQIRMPSVSSETWLSFHIDRDPASPWPVGVYEVTIAFDGVVVQRATVDVVNQN
jgi:hypothetical protein